MRVDVCWLVAFATCAAVQAFADDTPSPVAADTVDIDFLEYLGTLVREGDEWLDASDIAPPAEMPHVANDDPLGLPPEWEN